MLINIESNIIFISERIMKQLKNPNIRKASKIIIRLTNSIITRSNRVLRIEL
jgi:hypothetical protein